MVHSSISGRNALPGLPELCSLNRRMSGEAGPRWTGHSASPRAGAIHQTSSVFSTSRQLWMPFTTALPMSRHTPRSVLMTTDAIGGVWTYSLELARSLAAHRIHVLLATMGQPLSPEQQAEAAAI